MKTTLELTDRSYRQIKARAALRGQTVKPFSLEALRDKLAADRASPSQQPRSKAVVGKANPRDAAEVHRIIDEEFEQIHPEDWK